MRLRGGNRIDGVVKIIDMSIAKVGTQTETQSFVLLSLVPSSTDKVLGSTWRHAHKYQSIVMVSAIEKMEEDPVHNKSKDAAANPSDVNPSNTISKSGRVQRQSCLAARDHILAWKLQQQWTFRAYTGALSDSGSKARKATKAARAGKTLEVQKNGKISKANRSQGGKNAIKKSRKVLHGTPEVHSAARKFAENDHSGARRSNKVSEKKIAKQQKRKNSAAGEAENDGMGGESNNEVKVETQEDDAMQNEETEEGGKVVNADTQGEEESRETVNNTEDAAARNAEIKRSKMDRFLKKLKAAREARFRRTLAIADKGMKKSEWKDPDAPISFVLCPAEDHRRGIDKQEMDPTYMGKLQRSNLSTPPEATVLHLKRFLISKLLPSADVNVKICTDRPLKVDFGRDVQVSEVQIACRGIVLSSDKTLYAIKHLLWPENHKVESLMRLVSRFDVIEQLAPVLRYRRVPVLKNFSSNASMLSSASGLSAQPSGASSSGFVSQSVASCPTVDLKHGAEEIQQTLATLMSHQQRHGNNQRIASINNLCNLSQDKKAKNGTDDVRLLSQKALLHLGGHNGTNLNSVISMLANSQKLSGVEQTAQERRNQIDFTSLLSQRPIRAQGMNPVNNFLATPAANLQSNGEKLVNNLFQKPKGFAEVVQQTQQNQPKSEQKKRSLSSNAADRQAASNGASVSFSGKMFSNLQMQMQGKSPPQVHLNLPSSPDSLSSQPKASEPPSTPFFKSVLKGSTSSLLAAMAPIKAQHSSAPLPRKASATGLEKEQGGGSCWNGNGAAQRLMGASRPTHEFVSCDGTRKGGADMKCDCTGPYTACTELSLPQVLFL
eukprot:401233-Hanusia_phi.AAC.2